MWFEGFQDGCHGGHLGYQNGTILAILNLHVAHMPSTKFLLHLTYSSRADNNWRLSRWRPWHHHWYDFVGNVKIMKSYCRDGPRHKLTWSKAQGELTIEDLQDGYCGSHHGYCNKMVLAILNLHVARMPPTKFWLDPTPFQEQMRFEDL